MAYNPAIPVNATLIDANPIRENFRILDPTGVEADPLIIKGNIETWDNIYLNSDGVDGDSFVYFYEGVKTGAYFQWKNSATRFLASHSIESASNLMADSAVYVNADWTAGDQDATIYFNSTSQSARFDYGMGEFVLSENLNIDGSQIRIGIRDQNDALVARYLFFASQEANADAGGIRYNYSLNRMEYSNDGGVTWLEITSPTGTSGLDTVLGVGNIAYGKEMYIGGIYVLSAYTGDYLGLTGSAGTIGPELEFFVAGLDTGRISFDGSENEFVVDRETAFRDSTSAYKNVYVKDIYMNESVGAAPSVSRIRMGTIAAVRTITGSVVGAPSDSLIISFPNFGVYGTATANTLASNGIIQVNEDYVAGDEDAIIEFNAGTESLKFDWGFGAIVVSTTKFWIGDGSAEDGYLYFGNTTLCNVKSAIADGKMYFSDVTGTYSLDALGGGSPVPTLDAVLTAGATTAQTIEVGIMRSRGNAYINYDGPDGNSFLYFYQTFSPTGAYLEFVDASALFLFSHPFSGDLKSSGNFYIKNGTDADFTDVDLYFGSVSPRIIHWDFTDNRFEFPNGMLIDGDIGANGTMTINANGSSAAENATLNFCGTLSEILKWDFTNSRFDFSDDLKVNGTLETTGLLKALAATNSIEVAPNTYIFTPTGAATSGMYFNLVAPAIEYRVSGLAGFLINMAATPYGTIAPRLYTQSAEPTTAQCPAGYMCFHKDSDDAKLYLCFNDTGTVKTVELI